MTKSFHLLKKLICVLSCLFMSSVSSAKVVERIVAIVNNEIISLSDLDTLKEKLKKGGLTDDALLKIFDLANLQKNDKEMVQYLIAEKIFDSEIKKGNFEASVERVEKEIGEIARKNGITQDQLKAALKKQGVNLSEYQDFIKSTIERQGLIEREVSSKIKISDDEVYEYYAKTTKEALSEEHFEYTLSHMIFLSSTAGVDAAKQKTLTVLEKIEKGDSFESLASKYSEDPNFTQGGALGTFKGVDLNPKLAQAVKKLNVGEVSSVIDLGGNNFQIIKLVSKKVIPNPKAKAQEGKIRGILFEASFKRQLQDWLDRKRQETFIKINI